MCIRIALITLYPPPQEGPLRLLVFVFMPTLLKLSDIYFEALGLKNDSLGTKDFGFRLPVGQTMSANCHYQTLFQPPAARLRPFQLISAHFSLKLKFNIRAEY